MIADYLTLLADLVPDDAGRLTPDQIERALASAVAAYSVARPRTVVADVVSDGSQTLALPAAWAPGLSKLETIETPVGSVPPAVLDKSDWALYQGVSGAVIMLAWRLAVGATARLTFGALHLLAEVDDTIPLNHRDAVAKQAAAALCDQLATFYASDSDSTIQAGMAPGQTRSQAYAARAREYRKQFEASVGPVSPSTLPAGTVVSFGQQDAHGLPFLFHPPRRLR